jgi:4-hydroxybutyrate CoA-transferase
MTSCYKSRLTTAVKAVEAVQSGNRVYIHNGCAAPVDLVAALTSRGASLRDVEILHMATMGIADYSRPEYEGHFRHNSLFTGCNVRLAVQEGRADYTPIFLSEIEGLFCSGALPIDVCLLQCTPPDDYGYMSLGTSIDVTMAAVEASRYVIVQINPLMPRTLGDSFLHVSAVDAFVEANHPLVEYPQPEVTSLHHAIARHVAALVPDGATIQTGIGGIPEAVLGFLGGHDDLGIHSEMVPDGVIELMEKGIINNRRKSLNRDKAVAGFVLGSRRLFDFIHNNPAFEFRATSYCNDPFVIAQNDRMVAVNSALEVDITGQVCSDSVGFTPYSGIGGQVDFLRGAARSRGGLPIIALPATAKNGAISRIVPTLRPGAGVVTSRGDVHYVITEHGVAYLHGKTLRQRAEALIRIAAPEFRPELERRAVEAKILSANPSLVAV